MSKILKSLRKSNQNLGAICRICLQKRANLRNLFETPAHSVLKKLCPSVQIAKDDGLPDKICVFCHNQISWFVGFKKKIERNSRVLKQFAKQKTRRSDILDKAVREADILRYNEDAGGIVHTIEITSRHGLLLDEPPPLVPLEPSSHLDTKLVVTPKLPENAPPLVPIKPLTALTPASIAKALSDNVENPVQLNSLQCNVCNEEFKTVHALKSHCAQHCQSNLNMQCNICKKQINDRARLITHLKGHMISKNYVCKMCDKRYPNPSTFRIHMRTHTGERPFKCQICNKGFIRWAGVVGHMKTHTSNKPHKCPTCNKTFKIASNLQRHKILHTGVLPFCCSYCGKTFSQADNLQFHIRTYHTLERPYLCNECGKSFVSSTRLKRHMWIHVGYKPYKCKYCPKSYSNSNDRNVHENCHGESNVSKKKPYVCAKCSMRFLHPCRLERHLNTHERPFACTECVKTFSSQSLLNRHLASKHSMVYLHELSGNDTSLRQEP